MYVLKMAEGEGLEDREEYSMSTFHPLPEGHTPLPSPLLIVFVSRIGERREGNISSVTQHLKIGCIKTPLVKKVYW